MKINGTGKSTLLSAIRKGMTFMFLGTSTNKFTKNNDTKVEGFTTWDTRFVEDDSGFQYPTLLKLWSTNWWQKISMEIANIQVT